MKIHTFIFNWRNQYNKTLEKIEQFREIGIHPTVINSDEAFYLDNWHNLGDDAYFTAQMLKALEVFDGEVLFHIQADASYNRWAELIADAKKYYDLYKWGIYAPNVDYTWYDSSRTDLDCFTVDETPLKMVANTDCTCWFIHKDVINKATERDINFAPYKMGWSFDIVYPALSYLMKRPVLRDYSHTIKHPRGTNYDTQQAEKEMADLYNSLPVDIQEAFYYIKGDRMQLSKYYMDQQ